CDLLAKPGLLGTCASRTGTFEGQLFHHRVASAGSYAPRAGPLPVQTTEVRTEASSFLKVLSLIPRPCFVTHPPFANFLQRGRWSTVFFQGDGGTGNGPSSGFLLDKSSVHSHDEHQQRGELSKRWTGS